MSLQSNILEDESGFFQLGLDVETEYLNFALGQPLPSSWIYFPTEESPSTRFKYISVEINLSPDLFSWER